MALVGMPDPRLGERGCAYVVPRDPRNPPTLADLCAYLEAEGLAKYKWPERLELTDALPRTQIGKVAKADLRARLERPILRTGRAGSGLGGAAGQAVDEDVDQEIEALVGVG
jgi:non-ribosomal peptide synthetase component E (peptide arylation enzyme)